MKPSVLLLPTSYAIQAWRGLRMAMHCLWAAIFLLLAKPAPDRLCRFKQVWSLQLLAILGIRLEIDEGGGVVSGSLWVANHISWLDICALNAYCPLCFVAKSEIKNWPLLGWLVASGGTVFLCRDSRRHAREVGETIGHHLKTGQDVAFFPEGTSTDGSRLLKFRAALFQGAVDSGRPVQPWPSPTTMHWAGLPLPPPMLATSVSAIACEPSWLAAP
jgi:1-acyl-sn-glycerol-3-phosphate acyltransferase